MPFIFEDINFEDIHLEKIWKYKIVCVGVLIIFQVI